MRGILGLWRQFGNEACLHLNSLLSGHLVHLMRGRLRGGVAEKVKGVSATLQDRAKRKMKECVENNG